MNNSITETAHLQVLPHLTPGAIAVDATAGNGHDTVFLAAQVAPTGRVFAFDRQSTAITSAQRNVARSGLQNTVTWIEACHANMRQHVPHNLHGYVDVIMFNLGYLPGGDKHVTTTTDTTLAALHAAIDLLRMGGFLSVIAYPGHREGQRETRAVASWFSRYTSIKGRHYDPDATTPVLFTALRTRANSGVGIVNKPLEVGQTHILERSDDAPRVP